MRLIAALLYYGGGAGFLASLWACSFAAGRGRPGRLLPLALTAMTPFALLHWLGQLLRGYVWTNAAGTLVVSTACWFTIRTWRHQHDAQRPPG